MKRSEYPPLTAAHAAVIKRMLLNGRHHQHQIAAKLGINQGRVSEVKQGKRFAHVPPAPFLPPDLI